VYVYTNSKVVAASKENDEKKWYHKNVESEDSDCLDEEEENNIYDSNYDASNVCDAMKNDMHRSNQGYMDGRTDVQRPRPLVLERPPT